MTMLYDTSDWFRRTLAVLMAIEVVALGSWVLATVLPDGSTAVAQQPTISAEAAAPAVARPAPVAAGMKQPGKQKVPKAPAPAAPGPGGTGGGSGIASTPAHTPSAKTGAAVDPAAAAAWEAEPKATSTPDGRRTIAEGTGRVGPVKLGMPLQQVESAVGEKLVTVQEASGSSRRFEAVAPSKGLKVSGQKGRIDTVTVTNTGEGPSYRTRRGVTIGTSVKSLSRKYVWAQKVCDREWWVRNGQTTLQMTTGSDSVSAITVTSRPQPPFANCR